MPKAKNNDTIENSTAANVDYEADFWQMADAPCGSMNAVKYKLIVLGLSFLRDYSEVRR
ncbi:MAG: hypothetical protein ACRERD_31765 [Candidatus Binatia bacterium]